MKTSPRLLRASGVGLALAALAACSDQPTPAAVTPMADGDVSLSLSSLSADVGNTVAVSLSARQLDGLQGVLRYDASALRYMGQSSDDDTWFAVNARTPGALNLAALSLNGLDGDRMQLVFEVRRGAYASGLSFDAATGADMRGGMPVSVPVTVTPLAAGGAVPADARLVDAQDLLNRAYETDRVMGKVGERATPQLRPGAYRLNLQYGDATLDGAVNATDAVFIINVAAGSAEMITGTDSPARDAVVAGNPAPYNVGSSTLLPGQEPAGGRIVDVTDAVAIINEAAFGNQPVVGELIPGRGPLATNRVNVTGVVSTDQTWTRNNVYQLDGLVRVRNATLTIEPGTVIEGNSAQVSALFIERTARIIANGTFNEPIVMTCTAATKTKGCWGGLVVSGNAPTSFQNTATVGDTLLSVAIPGRTTAGCLTNAGEGGGPIFGGCNPADSSGVLRYVRSEYAGFLLSANNELNGITLNGVGAGTVVENIQVHAGLDDGLELFGGTVDVRNVVLTDNSDDSFDFAEGWVGRAQFLIIQMDPQDGDKGFEVDNMPNNTAFGGFANQSPWGTIGEVWNATLIGKRTSEAVGPVAGNSVNEALHLRRGTKSIFRNLLVFGWPRALDLDDLQSCQTDGNGAELEVGTSWFGELASGLGNTGSSGVTVTAGVSNCRNMTIPAGSNTAAEFIVQAGTRAGIANVIGAAGVNPFSGGATQSSVSFSRSVPDFRPRSDFSMAGAAAPVSRRLSIAQNGGSGTIATLTRNEFFNASATYFGGVAPATVARTNVPWYSGWTRGN